MNKNSLSILAFPAAVLFVLLATLQPITACQVPVFRYALEHWDPDMLQVVVLHQGSLSDSQQQLVTRMEEANTEATEPVNLRLSLIDTNEEHPPTYLEAHLL